METNFSNELKYVLDQSRVEAARHNSSLIKAEHLLLAILSKSESHAFKALSKLLDDDAMYKLRDSLDNSLFEQPGSVNALAVSDLANRIIKLSVLEARMLKSNVVDSEHLLLAIFHNSEVQNLDIMSMFRDAGVTYESLYKLLANVADAPQMGASFSDEEDEDEDGDAFGASSRQQSSSSAQRPSSSGRKGNDTPVLDKFGNDMTRAAEEGRLDPVIGREVEIERLAQILSRRKKNNPVLIGEPGVGKSAIVEGLALRIVQRKVSRILFDKRVISLDMASIVAGTKYRGQFEERIKSILNELSKNKDVILFIDELLSLIHI